MIRILLWLWAIEYKNGSSSVARLTNEIFYESTLFNSWRNISHIYSGIPLLVMDSSTNMRLIILLNHSKSYIWVLIECMYYFFLIVMVSQKCEYRVKLVSQEHEVLINSVVVDFIPMQIAYIDKCFKPLLCVFFILFFNSSQNAWNLQCNISLIVWFVRMPKYYTNIILISHVL